MLAQSRGRAEESIQKIKSELGGKADLEYLQLKLQSIASAAATGREFLERETRLDILVANAGINSKNELSDDGIEICMAVNHVGHQAFITTVLPLMLSTAKRHDIATHIAITASHAHFDVADAGDFDFDFFTTTDTPLHGGVMDFAVRYARSKLANVLFVKHVSALLMSPEYREQGGEKVFVNAAHPGAVRTEMIDGIAPLSNRWIGMIICWFVGTFGLSVPDGALTQLFLATSPKVESEGIRGRYFVPVAKEIPPNKLVTEELAAKLWDWTDSHIKRALVN